MLLRGGYLCKICKHNEWICVFAAFVAIVVIITYNCPVPYSSGDKTSYTAENCVWLIEEVWSSCTKSTLNREEGDYYWIGLQARLFKGFGALEYSGKEMYKTPLILLICPKLTRKVKLDLLILLVWGSKCNTCYGSWTFWILYSASLKILIIKEANYCGGSCVVKTKCSDKQFIYICLILSFKMKIKHENINSAFLLVALMLLSLSFWWLIINKETYKHKSTVLYLNCYPTPDWGSMIINMYGQCGWSGCLLINFTLTQ